MSSLLNIFEQAKFNESHLKDRFENVKTEAVREGVDVYDIMIFTNGDVIPYLLKAVTTKETYQSYNKAILQKHSNDMVSEMQEQYKNIHQFLEDNKIVLSLVK